MADELVEDRIEELQDDDFRLAYGEELSKLEFAVTLAQARSTSGITQQQLAEVLGVSQTYVARLESGDANPTLGRVGRVFAALWVRPSWNPRPLISADDASTIVIEAQAAGRDHDPLITYPVMDELHPPFNYTWSTPGVGSSSLSFLQQYDQSTWVPVFPNPIEPPVQLVRTGG